MFQRGIKKNNVVVIFSPNSIKYPLYFFELAAIRAIATTVNLLYTVSEISKQVKDSKTKLIVTVEDLLHKVRDFGLPVILLGSHQNPILPIGNIPSIVMFNELLNNEGSVDLIIDLHGIKQDDTVALLYSSGTTRTSQGVVLTHRNFIIGSLMITVDQDWAGEKHNVFLCVLPMFHVFGLSIIVYAQLQRGNAIVFMSKFDLRLMLEAVERYNVTHMFIVPPVVLALAKNNVVKKYNLSSLKLIGSVAPHLEGN